MYECVFTLAQLLPLSSYTLMQAAGAEIKGIISATTEFHKLMRDEKLLHLSKDVAVERSKLVSR